MADALRHLLEGVIDYAGLFPPAKLSMPDSVSRYLRYRKGPESFIMSRFICPADRLGELAAELRSQDSGDLVEISVTGRGGADRSAWEAGMAADTADLNSFSKATEGIAEVCAYEVRLAPGCDVPRCAKDLRGFSEVEVYAELPWDERLADGLAALAETEWLEAKGRTGGVDRAAFPSTDQLALFLRECSNLDLPFKLTAGLHEPIRHEDAQVGGIHGFLNILVALAMINAHDLSLREIGDVLDEQDASSFKFKGEKLSWRKLSASMVDAEAARDVFVAFGSCSIDEPIAGLSKLGLLQAAGV